jgi:F-type H+-transporting ATPase subunit a
VAGAGFFDGVVFYIFGRAIYGSIVLSWGLTFVLSLLCWLLSRHFRCDNPGALQVLLENLLSMMENTIASILPGRVELVFPFVATLWIYIFLSSLLGIVPGLSSPTSDLSVTAALAISVFFSVHWFGLRANGFKVYIRHYLEPNPIMLPFHIISEVSRTLALAIRLFGNVMSLELAAILVLMVAGLLVPIPLLMLHIVESLIQAYLFGVLSLIYIAGGIQSQESGLQKSKEE